jgi:hypothetical protein
LLPGAAGLLAGEGRGSGQILTPEKQPFHLLHQKDIFHLLKDLF